MKQRKVLIAIAVVIFGETFKRFQKTFKSFAGNA